MGTAGATARHVARSDQMKLLARLGLGARGVIYLLIGWLAVLLALGKRPAEADQRGAMQEATRHTGGFLLLWVIAVGLTCYALWRFSEAAFGVVGEGNKAGPRVQSFVRGCIYAFFAVSAFTLLAHAHTSNQNAQSEFLTGRAMTHSGGRILVGVVGAVIVVAGLVLVAEGLTRRFTKYFDKAEMSAETRRVVWILGTVGTAARGVAFALTGFFVVRAAWEYDPKKAQGLDGALRTTLASSSYGRLWVGLVAVGLIAFGLYGLAEARWRRT
jgi:hypothetical protein